MNKSKRGWIVLGWNGVPVLGSDYETKGISFYQTRSGAREWAIFKVETVAKATLTWDDGKVN